MNYQLKQFKKAKRKGKIGIFKKNKKVFKF